MIKLIIQNEGKKKKKYLKAVKPSAVVKIDILKTSLGHLLGKPIDLRYQMRSVKTVTRDAVRIIEGKGFKEGSYLVSNYKKTVEDYIVSGSANLVSVNIQGIYILLEDLLADNAKKLEKLLVCPASELSVLNSIFVAKIHGATGKELDLVKLAFNYKDLSVEIKNFFNEGNFINYCPYCNLEKVEILPISKKANATAHHLDHFFSQTDHPLLSYSMFNLVPSGYICNSKNKGEITFSDDYHLNPYLGGFGVNVRFVPIGPLGKVIGIDIRFGSSTGLKELRQLIGNQSSIDELHENGNVNVFKLRTKYSDEEHIELANIVLNRIRHAHSGIRSIGKFIELMEEADPEQIHLDWYKEQISTPFLSKDFGTRRDAKFNRDIHDYYFESNRNDIDIFFSYIDTFLQKY